MHRYGKTQCPTNLAAYFRVGENMQELTDKPKYIRETYVREVCDNRPQKTETHRTRFATEGNIIYYPGEVSTLTSELTTMKLHVNSTISNVKSRCMCMDMKDFTWATIWINQNIPWYRYPRYHKNFSTNKNQGKITQWVHLCTGKNITW